MTREQREKLSRIRGTLEMLSFCEGTTITLSMSIGLQRFANVIAELLIEDEMDGGDEAC